MGYRAPLLRDARLSSKLGNGCIFNIQWRLHEYPVGLIKYNRLKLITQHPEPACSVHTYWCYNASKVLSKSNVVQIETPHYDSPQIWGRIFPQWRARDQLRIDAYRGDWSLVSTNKLFIQKPIINVYKTLQKGPTLAFTYSLIKRFQKEAGEQEHKGL